MKTETLVTANERTGRSPKGVPSLGYGDYIRFSNLLLERCGLYFTDNRRSEFEHRLLHAFSASTCADLDEFYNLLIDPIAGALEMDLLVNAITVSESHFFRDTAQFNALYTHVLPKIIERKRALHTLRIWSAGCASGEEPYSIAILLRELLPDVENWAITILGTDINTDSLVRARSAIYGSWAFREERALQLRPRYFKQNNDRYELSPVVRNMVTFNKLNLVEPCFPSYETNTMSMDLVLCRNVTIYFNEDITRWIVARFYDALVDGGWLAVGHSEPSLSVYRRFRVRNFPDTILYQRLAQTASLRRPFTKVTAPLRIPIPPPPIPNDTPNLVQQHTPQPTADTCLPIPTVSPSPSVFPSSMEEDPLPQVHELLEYGRSEDAVNVLLKLIQVRPNDAKICILLGQAYANLGDWQEAETWCRQAFKYDRLALDAYYILSLVLQHQDKLEQAIDSMKKVVYIDRNYILGHYGLANLYYAYGWLPQAQKSLDNALRVLQGKPEEETVTGSKSITIKRLREAIIRQQQAWSVA